MVYQVQLLRSRVGAASRLSLLLDASGDANAVAVASRVVNTSRGPDTVSTVNAVGAGDEVATVELKVVIFVDGPAGALAVARAGLAADGVSDLALT
jgi:hypothetical protein